MYGTYEKGSCNIFQWSCFNIFINLHVHGIIESIILQYQSHGYWYGTVPSRYVATVESSTCKCTLYVHYRIYLVFSFYFFLNFRTVVLIMINVKCIIYVRTIALLYGTVLVTEDIIKNHNWSCFGN